MISRRLLRIKVIKALFAHLKSESDNMAATEKELILSADKAYDLYYQMMALPVEVARYARQRIEIAQAKKLPTYEDLHPNTKFVDNRVIALIERSDSVNDRLAARKLGWAKQEDLIRILYTKFSESDEYKQYMASPERSFHEDCQLVQQLFNQMLDCDELDEALEEMSIYWVDDLAYIIAMVIRTLSSTRESAEQIKMDKQYKSEDDLYFMRTLFEKTLIHYNEYQQRIEQFIRNWDVERIVFMDNLILAAALAELEHFETIPVKVTMDEWIEISKYYSTPGSWQFINGVLDRMVESMNAEGQIRKTGRGLI